MTEWNYPWGTIHETVDDDGRTAYYAMIALQNADGTPSEPMRFVDWKSNYYDRAELAAAVELEMSLWEMEDEEQSPAESMESPSPRAPVDPATRRGDSSGFRRVVLAVGLVVAALIVVGMFLGSLGGDAGVDDPRDPCFGAPGEC